MRTMFVLALAIVVSATSAFGQTPPPPVGGNNGSNPAMADIITNLRVDNNNPRIGDQVVVTWGLDSSVSHAASSLRAKITLNNGPNEARVADDLPAMVFSHTFTLTETLIGTLNQPQRFKLRVAVGGHQPEVEMTVRPANRRPQIISLETPSTLVAGRDNLIVNGNVLDEDNDPLTFRIQRHVSTVGEWRNVNGASNTLPMNVLLGEVPESVLVRFRMQVTDSSGLSEEREFDVQLLPPPQLLPPADPVGGAAAGNPVLVEVAPVSSSTPSSPDVAPVGSTTDPGVAAVSTASTPAPPAPTPQSPGPPSRRSASMRSAVPMDLPPQDLNRIELMPQQRLVYDPVTHRYRLELLPPQTPTPARK